MNSPACTSVLTFLTAASLGLAGCASSNSASSASDADGRDLALGAFSGKQTPVIAFRVDGMACRNCANEIARELQEVPGVKAAMIDFDSSLARVALDADPAKAANMQALHAAVEHWRTEHFSVPASEDPNCLDPQRREELQKSAGSGSGNADN